MMASTLHASDAAGKPRLVFCTQRCWWCLAFAVSAIPGPRPQSRSATAFGSCTLVTQADLVDIVTFSAQDRMLLHKLFAWQLLVVATQTVWKGFEEPNTGLYYPVCSP